MMFNPIEIICYYVAQPVIDLLAYLLNEVHYSAFFAGICVIGVLFGLLMGIVSVIWYKCCRPECYEQKLQMNPGGEGDLTNIKNKKE
ncbi:uncharacterized protein LOC115758939 [Drosophila novamexicana]|uniref:uncharacterized protein LOC115758939 n=1 Tax=Drosophila novamexicana TaxID=47314 RepID=UPI0011E5CE01|nr:uncharacterized protein LOC115758939 [Drosophila novamexicana]